MQRLTKGIWMILKIKGFILKDYLLSLLIMISLLPIIVGSLKISSNYLINDSDIQDELSIMQLREKLIIASDIEIDNGQLNYRIGDDFYELKFNKGRLYLTPGYQLFLDEVESCCFDIENNTLMIKYVKQNKNRVWALAKV